MRLEIGRATNFVCGDCFGIKLLVKFAAFIAMSFSLLFAVCSLAPSLAKRNADLSGDRHVLLRRTETSETVKEDPFSGFKLYGPWTASSVGCTSTGWQGKYSIAGGAVPMLSVQIEPETTTFDWLNSELASMETWMQRYAEIHFGISSVLTMVGLVGWVGLIQWRDDDEEGKERYRSFLSASGDSAQAQASEEQGMVADWFRMKGPVSNDEVEKLFCHGPSVGSCFG